MFTQEIAYLLILVIFFIGYAAILLEFNIKINKTAPALIMAVLTWMVLFLTRGHDPNIDVLHLGEKFNEVSQIIFFLLGAMTIVEIVDSHKGFKILTDLISTRSKKKLLWIVSFVAFFLSAILDNLTTTIVLISLLRKLIPQPQDRMLYGSMVVLAANAGGAWTPIGDVTTTMLWINGHLTTASVMKSLFLPSLFSMMAALPLVGRGLKGSFSPQDTQSEIAEPGYKLLFFAGLGALIFVPIFKALTGLPPFMGMLIAVGALWLLTDLLHGHDEARKHLKVPYVLTRVDVSSLLFFLGILFCISSLGTAGLLQKLATFLDQTLSNASLIAIFIGLISAVIDNVPLVAAGMGMYTFPLDSPFWILLAYCAGTGGSLLILGSAAGVALMGLEKINFFWYLRKISFAALISYFVGLGVYFLQQMT